MRSWYFSRNCIGVPPTLPAATQWPKSTFAMLPFEIANASSKAVMLPCACVWYAA